MEQAVAAMAKDTTVICIELALYAEMIKDQPWTPGTLKGPGSLRQVGKTFLEQSFARDGPPRVRAGGPAVLELLLPEGRSVSSTSAARGTSCCRYPGTPAGRTSFATCSASWPTICR